MPSSYPPYPPTYPGAARTTRQEPVGWSLVTVTFKDASKREEFTMNVKANPSIGKHILSEMQSTGFCYLFSDRESVVIRADEIHSVHFTKLTTEEKP